MSALSRIPHRPSLSIVRLRPLFDSDHPRPNPRTLDPKQVFRGTSPFSRRAFRAAGHRHQVLAQATRLPGFGAVRSTEGVGTSEERQGGWRGGVGTVEPSLLLRYWCIVCRTYSNRNFVVANLHMLQRTDLLIGRCTPPRPYGAPPPPAVRYAYDCGTLQCTVCNTRAHALGLLTRYSVTSRRITYYVAR